MKPYAQLQAVRERVAKIGGATFKSYNRNVVKRQKRAKAAKKKGKL